MRKAEILTSLGFIAFAIAVVLQARAVGSGWVAGQPQSGFFPAWLGTLLGLCGVIILGQALRRGPDAVTTFFENRTGLLSVIKVSLTAIGMLTLTYLFGFYTAAIPYVFIYTRFVGRRGWIGSIALGLLVPIGSFYLFERVLQILLPRGVYTIIPFFQ